MSSDSKTKTTKPAASTEEKKKRTRREVTKDTLLTAMGNLVTRFDTEIQHHSDEGLPGSKLLRTLRKQFKVIQADAVRVMKLKTKKPRQQSENSGFKKPIQITEELRAFAGFGPGNFSRVDVTRVVCKYVKDHKLQNADDKRVIVTDAPLAKLLGLKTGDKTNFFQLQKLIQPQFIKVVVTPAEAKKAKKDAAAKRAAKKKAEKEAAESKSDSKAEVAKPEVKESKAEVKSAKTEKQKKAEAVAAAKRAEKTVDEDEDDE